MTHSKASLWLSMALDDELDAEQRAELDAHLAAHPEDRALSVALKQIDDDLRRAPIVAPPAGFSQRVMHLVQHQVPRPGLSTLLMLIVLGSLVVAGLIGTTLWKLALPAWALLQDTAMIASLVSGGTLVFDYWQHLVRGVLVTLESLLGLVSESSALPVALAVIFAVVLFAAQRWQRTTPQEEIA